MGSLIFVAVDEILFLDQGLNLGSLRSPSHWTTVEDTGLCYEKLTQTSVGRQVSSSGSGSRGSSGHVLEAVVFERDVASWVVRDDKSGDGGQ